jgi:undecaprenyl-diphosphatase
VIWIALALGVVEGLTEFIPVSSTGHLILVGHWLAFPEATAAAFEIFIQLGAVLAVVWYYRARLAALTAALPRDARARAFVAKVTLAFLPAAFVGVLFHRWIVRVLFGPLPVAAALAVGGVLLIAIDRPGRRAARTAALEDVGWAQAFVVGCVQVASLWPGMSRSGATIIGGLVAGLSRRAALEFSFFLAIPTLGAASLFALWRGRDALVAADAPVFAVGLVVSFAVALASIAFLLRYVREHDLRPFGWYRLALALLVVAQVAGGGAAALPEDDGAAAETSLIEQPLDLGADVLGALVHELLARRPRVALERLDRAPEADAPLGRQGQQPERAEQRKQARDRDERHAQHVRELRDPEEGARRLLGADHRDRHDRRLHPRAQVRDPGAERPQAVGLMIGLAERLLALGKDADRLAALEEDGPVRRRRLDGAEPSKRGADRRQVAHELRVEHPHHAMRRVLVLDGERDHRGVERQRSRVVGGEQHRPVLGDVLEALDLDAPVVAVEELEERLDAGAQRRIEAEGIGAVPSHQRRALAGAVAVRLPHRLSSHQRHSTREPSGCGLAHDLIA